MRTLILCLCLILIGCSNKTIQPNVTKKVDYPPAPKNIKDLVIRKTLSYKFLDTETKKEYIANIPTLIVYKCCPEWFPIDNCYYFRATDGGVDNICTYNTHEYIEFAHPESINIYRVRYAINGHIYDRYTVDRDTDRFTDINGLDIVLNTNTEQVSFKAYITEEGKEEIEKAKREVLEHNLAVTKWIDTLNYDQILMSTGNF